MGLPVDHPVGIFVVVPLVGFAATIVVFRMVIGAQQSEVFHGGDAALLVGDEVVRLAVDGWDAASGVCAVGLDEAEQEPL